MEALLNVPPFLLLPFILMLLAIAVMPMVAEKFWEPNKNKLIVSALLSVPVIVWFAAMGEFGHVSEAVLYDYVPFIVLLLGLFVITGGILIEIHSHPTPLVNTAIIGVAAVLASFLGTTGAAMLLIRPLLKINEPRKHKVHTILFFIACAANCGGLLTPLGDPPLFMMFLRGAEFTWFMGLLPEWLFTNVTLLVIYYLYDRSQIKKELEDVKNPDMKKSNKIKVSGGLNFLFLLGVVFAVAHLNPANYDFLKPGSISSFVREYFIIFMVILSLILTKKDVRERNKYSWDPIIEVGYLFIGIFITMVPCLIYFKNNAHAIGVSESYQFYYISGLLSSFLDNTPTAVTLHSLALGLGAKSVGATLVAGIPEIYLKSICIASVFFGSMTYIGNGPNFMVKSIAEGAGIKMPNFFAYMFKFSLIVLLPVYIIVQLLFL